VEDRVGNLPLEPDASEQLLLFLGLVDQLRLLVGQLVDRGRAMPRLEVLVNERLLRAESRSELEVVARRPSGP
jgi:hypothetical protein